MAAASCPPCAGSPSEQSAWSSSYEESRAKFRAAATACGARLESLPYDRRDGFESLWAASFARSLTIDVAIVGDATAAPSLLLHTSGTHGVEGYAGSALQVGFLRRCAEEAPPSGVAVVLVHAVNAHGMAEGRRWNERGVDLNRNYIGPREGESRIDGLVDTPATFANLAALPYELYYTAAPLLNKDAPVPEGVLGELVDFYLPTCCMILRHGFGPLKQAIAGGHYSTRSQALVDARRQPGLFFGGNQQEQSTRLVDGFLRTLGAARVAPLSRAAHVDVHTGLGALGHDTCLVFDTSGQRGHVSDLASVCELMGGDGSVEQLERLKGDGYHAEILRDAALGGTGYTIYGAMVESSLVAVSKAAEAAGQGPIGRGACILQEFGTVGNVSVLKALRAEAAVLRDAESRNEPPPSAEHPARRAVRDAFYLEHQPEWKAKVDARGRTLFAQSLAWLAESGGSARET